MHSEIFMKPPTLFVIHFDQCDPKKCTSLKLKKFNLVQFVPKIRFLPKNTIILDPYSSTVLSLNDKPLIEQSGLAVIDCSWNHAKEIFKNFRTGRKLPKLLAANSVNYGRWEKLTSAEAFSAALYIIGYTSHAELILSKFTWGHAFFELNYAILSELLDAKNKVQREGFEPPNY